MRETIYDVIIIGGGIAGLYSAYTIKRLSPDTTFLILEKNKKQCIGGRANYELFYGTKVVTGAGIGRKAKDKLLYKLLSDLKIETPIFHSEANYAPTIETVVDVGKIWKYLQHHYNTSSAEDAAKKGTFREYATKILGKTTYRHLVITSGYSDYEKEDVFETLYHYSMDDNYGSNTLFRVEWREMVLKLAHDIGISNMRFSNHVKKVVKVANSNPAIFMVQNKEGYKYYGKKVVLATTIAGIREVLPKYPIYKDIQGQPFLRLYGKFSQSCSGILKQYITGMTIVPGPLQKIIPMNPDKLVYMIAYSDNHPCLQLRDKIENTKENREYFCRLLEKSLGISERGALSLIAIKGFYWTVGTHYYKPLDDSNYENREMFIKKAQNPEPGIVVVGEAVSRKQGWTEGALESVKAAVATKTWVG
jgi:hypothetical protein